MKKFPIIPSVVTPFEESVAKANELQTLKEAMDLCPSTFSHLDRFTTYSLTEDKKVEFKNGEEVEVFSIGELYLAELCVGGIQRF